MTPALRDRIAALREKWLREDEDQDWFMCPECNGTGYSR